MTEIVYKTGNLIEAPEVVIVHGCNAMGRFGRGLALTIKEQLPWAYDAYRQSFLRNGLILGEVVWAINTNAGERPRIVGNAITQKYWQQEKEVDGRNADYDAIRAAFKEVDAYVLMTQNGAMDIAGIGSITRVGLPLIGCGLAKGKWSVVSKIIEDESLNYTPVVYLMDGVIPTD